MRLTGRVRDVPRRARRAVGASTRPLILRVTEEALDRYPDRTVAVVRARLERAGTRQPDEPLELRMVVSRLMVRAIDVHPAVGRRLVRTWLRREARRSSQ